MMECTKCGDLILSDQPAMCGKCAALPPVRSKPMLAATLRNEDTVEPLVRLRIEVVGEDGDACRKLLRDLCDMIDADTAGAPGYSVSTIEGSASCDVDTLPNAALTGSEAVPSNGVVGGKVV